MKLDNDDDDDLSPRNFRDFMASQKPITSLSEIEMKMLLFKILRHEREAFIYKNLFFASISFIIIYAFFTGKF